MSEFFKVDNLSIGSKQLFCILGPCVIEGEDAAFQLAEQLKKITAEVDVPFIFKASFDKANRSSLDSYRGPGMEKGLSVLKRIKEELAVPVLSDIHETRQAEIAADVLSVIQIPAFLSRQTDLLLAAGDTGLPVNVKKGQFMSADDMILVKDKLFSTGNKKVFFTERGTFFGYQNLVVDFRNIAIMKRMGCPVIIDATHSVQRPTAADGVSGGNPEFIPLIAASGIVSGADGIFLEVHPDPPRALSDGMNSFHLNALKPLLNRLKKLYNME